MDFLKIFERLFHVFIYFFHVCKTIFKNVIQLKPPLSSKRILKVFGRRPRGHRYKRTIRKPRDPLEVFPIIAWERIFEKLEEEDGNSGDLLNCSRVCKEFENVLQPTQHRWLFESVCPLLFPYLSVNELLNCRRVCNDWCRAVDFTLDDFELRRPFCEERTRGWSWISQRFNLKFHNKLQYVEMRNENGMSKFMRDMKPHGKNPFVGHSLCLGDKHPSIEDRNEDSPLSSFWKKGLELLLLFGENVRHIKFDVGNSHMAPKKFYKLLQQALSYLPNLKSLNITGEFTPIGGCFRYDCVCSKNKKERRSELRKLEECLEEEFSSLPKISSLETLKIGGRGLPQPICEKLISEINPNKLKRLEIHMRYIPCYSAFPITIRNPLPSLTDLHLWDEKNIEILEHLPTSVISQLGRLLLCFSDHDAASRIDCDHVCEVINRFGGTLKALYFLIDFGCRNINHFPFDPPLPSLRMLATPHLKSLEWEGHIFGRNYFPSIVAQSLEYLVSDPWWVYSGYYGDLGEPGMEFYKCAYNGELCFSPIWTEMPKLKLVKVWLAHRGITYQISCTREMHEHGVRGILSE